MNVSKKIMRNGQAKYGEFRIRVSEKLAQCRKLCIVAGLLSLLSACDASTRVAYDIESGVKKLGFNEGDYIEISHKPSSWFKGCSGRYMLVFYSSIGDKAQDGGGDGHGALSVTCQPPEPGYVNGWATTYHLNFVYVPVTVYVKKNKGETTIIKIQRVSGKASLVQLR